MSSPPPLRTPSLLFFPTPHPTFVRFAGDAEGYYYTASWDLGVVVKAGPYPATTVQWTHTLGGGGKLVAAVAVDELNVYAMANANNVVYVLDRGTGAQVRTLTLTGARSGHLGDLHGSLVVAMGKIWHSVTGRIIFRYDAVTGVKDQHFEVAEEVHSTAFDGTRYCHATGIAQRVSCYNLLQTNVPVSTATLRRPAPKHTGPYSVDTQSHGGGFYPPAREYWYPVWPTSTVQRYSESFQLLGSFDVGQGRSKMMQMWGDVDGYYYSANYDHGTVTKMGPYPQTDLIWSYDIQGVAAGVAADPDPGGRVYAMQNSGNVVHVLDKVTGVKVREILLTGGHYGRLHGGLAVVKGKLFYAKVFTADEERVYGRVVYRHDLETGVLDLEFAVHEAARNMAFNGFDLCLSGNREAIHCYEVVERPETCV